MARRKLLLVGFILIAIGVGLVMYSSTIAAWCAASEHKWNDKAVWGEHEFRAPSLYECWRLTR